MTAGISGEDTGEVRLVTGSVPVVQAPTPTSTGQHQAIKVVGRRGRRFTATSLALVIIAAAVSFMAVSQLRGPDRFRQQLEAESEGDLARILASLSSQSNALQQELASLKVELAKVQSSSAAQGAAAEQADSQLRALQVLSGTTPVQGPGLQLVIDDPRQVVTFDALVDAVQELRDAGAEALAINGRRIGTTSSFGQAGGRVTLDGVALPIPYNLDAIGPAETMEGGLQIPGGALDTLHALEGVHVDVHRSSNLQLPALQEPPTFDVAHPIGSKQ